MEMFVIKRKKYPQSVLLSLLLLTTGREIYAELTDDLFDISLPNVISASRLNQSVLQAPSAVTVIDKYMIELSGFIEFVDILRLVPGFQVAHFDSNHFTSTYHGYAWEWSNSLQILVDGRSTYHAGLSSIDWDTIGVQLADVERIEVVRGPAAPAYGSNSFAAAINIVTKALDAESKAHVEALVSSNHDRRLILKTNRHSKDFSYGITATHRDDDGDFARRNDGVQYSTHRKLTALNVRNRFNYQQHKFKTTLSVTHGNTGAYPEKLLSNDDRHISDQSFYLEWAYPWGGNKEIRATAYHHARDDNDIRQTINLNLLPFNEPVKSYVANLNDPYGYIGFQEFKMYRTDLEVQLNCSGERNSFIVGIGARDDNVKSQTYLVGKDTIKQNTFRLFFNDQLNVTDRLVLNAGLIYEGGQYTRDQFSPRVSINYTPYGKHSFRLAYSKAYRILTMLETNIVAKTVLEDGVVLDRRIETSDDLVSPEIYSIDIGYLGGMESLPVNWEFKAYKDTVKNRIDFVPYRGVNDLDGTVNKAINNGLYEVYGVEGSVIYRPSLQSMLRFHFNRGHSSSWELRRLNPDEYQRKRDYMPRESYGLLAGYKLNNWLLSAGVYHLGHMEWASDGEPMPYYTRYDVSVAKTYDLGRSDLQLKFMAQRLGGDHQEFNDEFEFEKEFYMQLKWTLD